MVQLRSRPIGASKKKFDLIDTSLLLQCDDGLFEAKASYLSLRSRRGADGSTRGTSGSSEF